MRHQRVNADWIRLTPTNAVNNVNGVGTCEREEVFAAMHDGLLDVQLAFTRKVVSELRDFDNLYYEVCNEPYFGGVTMEWQHAIADAIATTQPRKKAGAVVFVISFIH